MGLNPDLGALPALVHILRGPCVRFSVLFAECGLRNAFNLSRTLRSFSEMSKKKTRKRASTVKLIFSSVCETHVGIPEGQHWRSRA